MASIVLGSVPINGHVMPMLAVARFFTARGDRVRFLTGSRFADAVRSTGAEFIPLPGLADFDDRQDFNTLDPGRARRKGSRALASDILQFFARPARDQYRAVMAAQAEEPADALLTDVTFAAGAFLVGHPRGVRPPLVACGVMPLAIRSRDTAPFGMGLVPRAGLPGRVRNAVLRRLADRTVFPEVTRTAHEINREIHGRPLGFSVFDWPRHAEALAQFTVQEFEYPRSDAPDTLHFIGPVLGSGPRIPLPPWWRDLDGSRPVVHLTQGTFANWDHRQLIAPALEGLAGDDVLLVVTTGGRPLDTLPPLPANARAAEMLPYDDLLPRTDVFVTNGGFGGVQHALRCGVPVVTTGGLEDKPEVGARVAWSGVGRRIRSETPSAADIATAVHAVLAEPAYRRAARAVAAAMERAGGLPELGGIVDGLIDPGRYPAP